MIVEHFGFNDLTKTVTTTGVKEDVSEGGEIESPLSPVEAAQFRAVAARFITLRQIVQICCLQRRKFVGKCQPRQSDLVKSLSA